MIYWEYTGSCISAPSMPEETPGVTEAFRCSLEHPPGASPEPQAGQQHKEGSGSTSRDPAVSPQGRAGLGHRLPCPSQAGSSVLVLAHRAKGWSLINSCTQPDPKALLGARGVPAQPQAGGTCSQQEVLPVSGILTIPVPNSRHPVLFLLLKSEVLQLLLLSDAHQLLSSPCLSNSRH